MAAIHREEQRWDLLCWDILYILTTLKSFPNLVDDAEEKVRRYKEELQELENKTATDLFKNSNLLQAKMSALTKDMDELFEQNASEEEVKRQLEIFLTLGNPLSERLNDAAFVAHFEDVDAALQLWHAHLHAVWCYAAVYNTGFYRPPFSVATCRFPDWVLDLWRNATTAQRYQVLEGVLMVCEISERFDRWVALEDCTEWLREVRRWALWRGRWRAARRITKLIQRIATRQSRWEQERFESLSWLLPNMEAPLRSRDADTR